MITLNGAAGCLHHLLPQPPNKHFPKKKQSTVNKKIGLWKTTKTKNQTLLLMTDAPMCLSFSSHFFGFDWVVYYYSTLHVMTLLVCKIVNDLRQQNRWKIKPAATICLKFCDRKRHSCPKNSSLSKEKNLVCPWIGSRWCPKNVAIQKIEFWLPIILWRLSRLLFL